MNRLSIVLRGMAMGFADVIPGVSGGTIALITGVYLSFIEGVKSLQLRWLLPGLAWVFSGFSSAKRDAFLTPFLAIHWGFLIPLGVGIVSAFAVGSVIVPALMDGYPVETASFFIGLILASTIVPAQQMKRRGLRELAIVVFAIFATYFAVGTSVQPSVQWETVEMEQRIDLEHFMRHHPTMQTAEQAYCPTDADTDNAALRAAVAADPEQPGVAEQLEELCASLAALQGDIRASAAFREENQLGRKDEGNPFLTVTVPAYTTVQVSRPAYGYIFLSGVIGICAMVLPGISGSFFLLVLGVYHFMLSTALKGMIGELVSGQLPVTQAPYVVVFALGCLIGLLSFARLMSWLFARFPTPTLAVLVGLMLGSLRALWPFKIGEPHTGVINVLPALDATLIGPVVALLAGAALVTGVTVVGRKASVQRPDGA